jgi:hypothetical protein
MKRYVKSTNRTISLADILSKIDYFVLVDSCDNLNLSVINAPDEVDDDSEYYATLPDSRLAELSDNELHSINDPEILDRLVHLCKERLSSDQLAIYREEAKKKVPLDDAAKVDLLRMFSQCNKVFIENRRKNNDFRATYELTDDDILAILHNLKKSDFDSRTKSINYGHLGNNLVIMHPNILIPQKDIIVGANLYIKIDIDESTHSGVAFISIHPRQFD